MRSSSDKKRWGTCEDNIRQMTEKEVRENEHGISAG